MTLATLNSAEENVLEPLAKIGLESLEEQTEFLSQCLEAWLEASGRKQEIAPSEKLDADNVVYQGRVLVSALTLLPACINELKRNDLVLISRSAKKHLTKWFRKLMRRAGLLKDRRFISKLEFKKKGFLGSGGIGRFRDTLWAAIGTSRMPRSSENRAEVANAHRARIRSELAKQCLSSVFRRYCLKTTPNTARPLEHFPPPSDWRSPQPN